MSQQLRRRIKSLDRIDPYQNIIYFALVCWGVYLLTIAEPVTAVATSLFPTVYTVWAWTHIAAPITSWLGQIANLHKTIRPEREFYGWELQWAGDAGVCLMLATVVLAYAVSDDPAANYLVMLFGSLMAASFLLATRDVIRIALREGIYCECNHEH